MRGKRGPDDGSVAVELVEVDRAHDPADALAPTGGGSGDRPDDPSDDERPEPPAGQRRALWWVGAVVVVALVVAVVSVNVVEARRDAARREALAQLPWVLPPMSGPLEEVWRAPGGYVVAEGAGLLVLGDLDVMDGSLVAVDRESGAVAWERAGHRDSCWAFMDPPRSIDQAATATRLDSDLLLCVPSSTDTFAGATEGTGGDAVELVDVATGRTVESMPVEGAVIGADIVRSGVTGDDVTGSDLAGPEVVVSSILADGSLNVVRAVVGADEPVWTYRSEPGRLPPGGAAWGSVYDEVVLIEGEVSLAVSLETGQEVPVPDSLLDPVRPNYVSTLPLSDGAVAEWQYELTTGTPMAGRVVEADGSIRFTFEGEPWGPWWTDGSAAGIFVVKQGDIPDEPGYEGRLVGFDLATGEQLWSVPDTFTNGLFQIDGLALAAGVKTSVIDVRTGRRLWERPFTDEIAWVPLTDGDTVLLPERGNRGEGLAAVDLRTGTESWWMPIPGGVSDVRVEESGLIILLTGSETIAYR